MEVSCKKNCDCACCHRSPDATLLARFVSALCFVLHSSRFSCLVYSPCFLLFPSSLLLPYQTPGFGAGYDLYGVFWWKRGRDMVLRAGFPFPARWMEEV